MDLKVSRKEIRFMPEGPVDVLVDNVSDIYPVFDPNDPDTIIDVEILDDARSELLDRAMFAVMKQRGSDPLEPNDGIQWSEALMGDVSPLSIVQQAISSVGTEGPGVKVVPEVVKKGQKENLSFKVELTNAI